MKAMVKALGIFIVIFTIVFAVAYAQESGQTEEMLFVNDGYIEISGTISYAKPGDTVVVAVCDEAVDFTDEDAVSAAPAGSIVYYGETDVKSDGSYTFIFSLKTSGAYTAYIGNEDIDENRIVSVCYINEQANAAALEMLKNSADTEMVAVCLSENAADLGLFDSVFAEADKNRTAEIVFESLKNGIAYDTQSVLECIRKAAFISVLNDGGYSGSNYDIQYLYMDGTAAGNIYSETIKADLLIRISKKNFQNTQAFDAFVQEAVLLATVNRSSATQINTALKEYAEMLRISKSVITSALCNSIYEKKGFESIDALKTYINSYEEPKKGSSSNSSGGGSYSGSGNSGSANSYVGTMATAESASTELTARAVFDDIADLPWAAEAIEQLYYKGIINGKEAHLFYPYDAITRAEFAKLITLAFNMKLIDDSFPFADVSEDAWYYSYVKTAYLAGITNGIEEDRFGPDESITRQDLCTMVYRALTSAEAQLGQENAKAEFSDADIIADYAVEAIDTLCGAGIINGSDGAFLPLDNATRAEAAKVVYLTISKMR